MTKKFSILFSAAILAIGLFSSCTKKTVTPASTNTTVTPSMTAIVNGVAWAASDVTGLQNSGAVQIMGTLTSADQEMVIQMMASTPGTYTVDGLTTLFSYYYTNNGVTTVYQGNSGTIVVTSYTNGVIKGTYSGTATATSNVSDKVTVTNGTFTCQF